MIKSDTLTLLDEEKIRNSLRTSCPLIIEIFKSIPSTNTYLLSQNKDNAIKVCIAESQTQGKGRFQNDWHSPFGQNIYLSMLYPCKKNSNELSGLSLVASLAISQAIEQIIPLPKPLLIKWPNDIVCNDQKLGGILIELKEETSEYCNAIIGIGLNVNMVQDEQSAINQPWTSLKKLIAMDIDRNGLCANIIEHLLSYMNQFKSFGLKHFIKEWESRDYLKNKIIRLKSTGFEFEGLVKGIDNQGRLVIQSSNGIERHFYSGDTSLINRSGPTRIVATK